jgi:hypothetical protein
MGQLLGRAPPSERRLRICPPTATQCKYNSAFARTKIANFFSRRCQRESNLTEDELKLEKAKAAGRVAISQALKALKDSPAYKAASKSSQIILEEEKRREVVDRR